MVFFFPFPLSAGSVSRFAHLYSPPASCHAGCHLSHISCIFAISPPHLLPSRRAQVALPPPACSCVVLHLGRKRAQRCNFVSPARALFRDNNNSRRKVSCEGGDQTGGGGTSGWMVLGGQPRRCQQAVRAGKEAFASFLSKHLFFLQEICREIHNLVSF